MKVSLLLLMQPGAGKHAASISPVTASVFPTTGFFLPVDTIQLNLATWHLITSKD